MCWLGRTLSSATAGALDEEAELGTDALVFSALAPAGLKAAPFFLFNAAHWPDLAPWAISSPV
jgi:hypothetical protein